MLKEVESLLADITEIRKEKGELPNIETVLTFVWVLERIEGITDIYDANVSFCGHEIIMEWQNKKKNILSIMVSSPTKFICSYVGNIVSVDSNEPSMDVSELHEFDNPERLVEQAVNYLKRDIFQG